ncbi:MAG: hypothetical protein ACYCS1_05700 [Gammaproteobacteria bacterium]
MRSSGNRTPGASLSASSTPLRDALRTLSIAGNITLRFLYWVFEIAESRTYAATAVRY